MKAVLLSVIITLTIFGFTFDGFKSGTNKKDFLVEANSRDLPLSTNSVFSYSHFDWKHVANYEKYNILYTSYKLLGYKAQIRYYFQNNKLYKVYIYWLNSNIKHKSNEFLETTKDALIQKYGDYSTKKRMMTGIRYTWRVSTDTTILLEKKFGGINLIYIDSTIDKKNPNSTKQDYNRL